MEEINILWDKFKAINSHDTAFHTSLGDMDLHNGMDFIELKFNPLDQSLHVIFQRNQYADVTIGRIDSLEFVFLNIESFSTSIGVGWAPPPIEAEVQLVDFVIFKKPSQDKEVHIQFHLGSGRIIDVRAEDVKLSKRDMVEKK